MPRPKVLDDVKKREICALVTAGMSLTKVARYVGCHRRTIYNEQQRDPEFAQRMRRAGLAAELNPLETMRRKAATHWRAAAWMIERQDRREAEDRAEAARFTRAELKVLAERVKEMVSGVVLDPFHGPHIEQKIENLFLEAVPGEVRQRSGGRQRSGPSGAEPIPFLEERWGQRAAAADTAAEDKASTSAEPVASSNASSNEAGKFTPVPKRGNLSAGNADRYRCKTP